MDEIAEVTKESELSGTQYEIEHNGKKLRMYWDGFCLTLTCEDAYAFVGSVNDPEVSPQGNVSIVFGLEDTLTRLDIKTDQ